MFLMSEELLDPFDERHSFHGDSVYTFCMELLIDWQSLLQSHLEHAPRPLIVIVGPTASGKTGFSIAVAMLLGNAEIINADSRQLYHHMNVGTAKITEQEKRGVKHHLINVLDPKDDVSIAWYKSKANAIIDDCHRRGVVPVLVGGSMLYVSAVVDGLDPLPAPDAQVRKKLEEEWEVDDGWTLYDKLVRIDPATAKNFQHQNKRYVVRAMELYALFGVPPSQIKQTIPPPYQTLMFGMHWPRELLTKRIDERTRILLDSGWIEEVESLLDRGYTAADPGMKSHGYREIIAWLSSDHQDREELASLISAKTRQYAKRQTTWWNDDERIKWIDAARL